MFRPRPRRRPRLLLADEKTTMEIMEKMELHTNIIYSHTLPMKANLINSTAYGNFPMGFLLIGALQMILFFGVGVEQTD